MSRPQEPQAPSKVPAAADFLAEALDRLRTVASSEQNADNKNADALGFYAVMAVMAAAVEIAETIRTHNVDDASPKVTKLVQEFVQHIVSLLESASSENSPQATKLIAMIRVAMKVPFEYLPGKSMPASWNISMMSWSRIALRAETKASQEQLESALRSFLDARIGKQDS